MLILEVNKKNKDNKDNLISISSVFLKSDLIVYTLLLVVLVCLFLFFVIIPQSASQKGFNVTLKGKSIVTVEFSSSTPKISDDAIDFVTTENYENGFLITVYFNEEKTDFNKIYIDLSEKSADVIESTCSVSKDCVYSPKIKINGAIVCAPHSLKISPIGKDGFSEPIVG